MRLHVHRWGTGPRAVLIHGAVLGGAHAWRAQRPLTERWTLLAPDRPGHGGSPDAPQDFEPEAALVAEQLLDEPAHLAGLSYGAIVAMLAAARRPESVRSLTLLEPPATGLAPEVPEVQAAAARLEAIMRADDADPRRTLRDFFAVAGVPFGVPDPLPEPLERGARQLVGARHPGDAALPLEELTAAPFPKLVVSGGHDPMFETICDRLTEALGAERATVTGAKHLIPDAGEPFNRVLEAFWRSAEAG